MRNKKLFTLAISLLLGGFAVTSLAGCGEEQAEQPVANTFSISLNFDSTLGTVVASKTSGTTGETVEITITPNADAEIKSITINGESKTIANTVTFVTKEGVNTVSVVFEKIDKSFTVALEYDEEFGKVKIDKTEGTDYSAEDAAVKVTITPVEHYKVAQILVNGQDRVVDELEFTFIPQRGHNLVKVVFAQMSNFEELGTGYNIDITNFTYKGTPNFTKEEFLTLVNNGLKNLDVTEPNTVESIVYYFDAFYDKFVSTFDIKKVTLEKVVELLKEEEFDILIQIFTTGYQNPDKNQFEFIVDLVSLLVDNFTEDEFVKIMFMGASFFQFGYTGITYNTNSSYSGLKGTQIEDAEKYFRANNNAKAADELSAYINTSFFKETTFGEINERNSKSYLTIIRSVYKMVTRALTIDTGEDSLGIKIQNVVQFISKINSGDFLNPENFEKDYENVKFLGQVISEILPSYKSFKKIVEILDESENVFKFMQDFAAYVQGTPYVNGLGEALPAIMNEDSESIYYCIKYLGAFLSDLTLEDYKAAVTVVGQMMGMCQDTNVDYYASSVRLSKLVVNNLVNYGADADKIKDYLSEGLYLYFDIGNAGARTYVNNTGEYNTYSLTVTNNADLHTRIDKERVIDFINEVSTYDADKLTDENRKYIDEFIQYFQQSTSSEDPLIKYTTYEFTVNFDAQVGTELFSSVELTSEKEGAQAVDFTKIESFNKDTQNRGLATINIAENYDLIIPYNRYLNGGERIRLSSNNEMLTLTSSMLAINQNVKFSEEDALVIYNSNLVDYNNPPMEEEEDPTILGTFKFKDLNLDLTTTGTKYASIDYAEGKTFYFAYYVYGENDIHTEYGVSSNSQDQFGPYFLLNLPGQISSPFRRRYITFELNGYEYKMIIGDYEDLNFKDGEYYYVDTSKAGHFVEEIELDDGTKMTIGYSVYDPKGNVEINTRVYDKEHMDSYGRNNFEYQNLDISGTYNVDIQINSQFINDDGSYKSFRWSGYYNVTADDFENKLDNTTPGPKTDTLNITLGDKVYKFDYEYVVNEALEGNDQEYEWNFAVNDHYYLVGFGYSDSLMLASRAKEQKFIDYETGEIIDNTLLYDINEFIQVDVANIEVPEAAVEKGERYAFVNFTSREYPDEVMKGKVRIVYQDEYELYDSKVSLPFDGFGLEYLLEQEYLEVRHDARAKFSNIYNYNGELLDKPVSRQLNIPIEDIRDQLVKNGVGTHTLNITIDGEVYEVEYTVN